MKLNNNNNNQYLKLKIKLIYIILRLINKIYNLTIKSIKNRIIK